MQSPNKRIIINYTYMSADGSQDWRFDIIRNLSVTPNLILTLLEVILIRALTVCACVFCGSSPSAVAEFRRRWPDVSYDEVAGDEYCPFCDYTTPLTSCDCVTVRSQRE